PDQGVDEDERHHPGVESVYYRQRGVAGAAQPVLDRPEDGEGADAEHQAGGDEALDEGRVGPDRRTRPLEAPADGLAEGLDAVLEAHGLAHGPTDDQGDEREHDVSGLEGLLGADDEGGQAHALEDG